MNPASAQVSEAKQAIFRLASFPESETDLRITRNLNICHAQTSTQKFFSSITCGCLFSRKVYEQTTNLVAVYTSLKDTIRVLADQGDFKANVGGLQDACRKAVRVFNAVIDRCSENRAHSKSPSKENLISSLKINLGELFVEFDREKVTVTLPSYPLLPHGGIDYQALLGPSGSPPSPGSARSRIATL